MSEINLIVTAASPSWFVLVDSQTGERTVQQGIDKTTVGAVGPYATKREAEEWAAALTPQGEDE